MTREITGGKWYSQGKKVREFIFGRDDHKCVLCGSTENLVIDHIIPWKLCHDSTLNNLRTLCRSCNLRTRRAPYTQGLEYEDWMAKIEAEVKAYS